MSDQPLDLRRSLRILRRHKIFVAASVALGLAGGLCFAVLSTPMLTSNALADVGDLRFINRSGLWDAFYKG